MKTLTKIILVIAGVFFVFVLIAALSGNNKEPEPTNKEPSNKPAKPKQLSMGTHFSPKNMPFSFTDKDDTDEYFELNKQVGEHVTLNLEWNAEDFEPRAKELIRLSQAEGFKFHLYLSPISLEGDRDRPALPSYVEGNSFGDAEVRQAFKDKALELAALEPDYLGLATEANLLAENPEEFEHYVSLSKETYQEIKSRYPTQTVTISFQWDVMKSNSNFNILNRFKDSLDVYSFTSYPNILLTSKPEKIPADYYSSIRDHLPTERISFSELGWFSGEKGSEQTQADFYALLPDLMKDAEPEYVSLILMHDLPSEFVPDEKFSSLGIRTADGTPKKSWAVIAGY